MLDRFEQFLESLLTRATASHMRAVALVIVTALIVLLPGLDGLPPTDRDESRYVMASIQMMESGDYIDIRNQDLPRWKKPVGIYWLQVAAATVTGAGAEASISAFRIPSVLGIVFAGLLTYWAFYPRVGRKTAFLAALILVTSFDAVFEGHIAKTDAALLAAIMAAQGALFRLQSSRESGFGRMHVMFWCALAIGILIKGPLVLMPVAATLIGFVIHERSIALLGILSPLKGAALLALIVLPWFIAIGVVSDWAFYLESVGKDLVGKIGEQQERHGGPVGYYLMTIWLFFWPWAPLLVMAVPLLWGMRRQPLGAALIAWIVPLWLLFEGMSTKLPHYALPLYPALALLVAMWVSRESAVWTLQKVLALVLGAVGTGLVLSLVFFPEHILNLGRDVDELIALTASSPLMLALGACAAGLGLLALIAMATDHRLLTTASLMSAALIALPTFYGATMPRQTAFFPSKQIAQVYRAVETCTDKPLISVNFAEPSLVVQAGTKTVLSGLGPAVERANAEDGWLIAVTRHANDPQFEAKGFQRFGLFDDAIEGFNYNRNKLTQTVFFVRRSDPVWQQCDASLAAKADLP